MTDTPDTRIAAALDEDDRAFLESLEHDRGMFQQIGDSWHGPLGGWARLVFAIAAGLGIGLLYLVFRTATAPTHEAAMGWGLSLVGVLILQGFVKEWLFARMNMITILRELKRLQIEVAMLREDHAQ